MANDTFQIPANVWFSQAPQSPDVSTSAIADIAFALVPGESSIGPSIALLGSYNLAWPYIELYGGQLRKVFYVVAISTSTGNVYFADLNEFFLHREQDAILVRMSDGEANLEGPVRDIQGEIGHFNIDLAARLGLPPEADFYQVFVWLDDLVTPIQTIQVPANEARKGVDPSVFQASSSGLIEIGQSGESPTPTAGEIRTDLDFTKGSRYRVYAALPPGALDTPPTGGAPGNPMVSVLAFNRQARTMVWATDPNAYASMVKQSIGLFDFNPFSVIAKPDPAANVYVVTVLGNVRNEVLPIFTDFQ